MAAARTIKTWYLVHKWTSLICTAFLMMLCITGLPLIFYHELDHLLYEEVEPADVPAGTARADLDRVAAAGLLRFPGKAIQFVSWDPDEPNLVFVSIGDAPDSNPERNKLVSVDAHTGQALDEINFQSRLTYFFYKLHVDMFAGLAGKLFLGLMGVLFVVAIVSGIVVYGPFMRRLDFGTVRMDRSSRAKWLDLHNLLGIVTVSWALVVGATGIINTWADLVVKLWQYDQLAEMVAPYKDKPAPATLGSLQTAVGIAQRTASEMTPSFVAFPGTPFSSKHHYAVFMRGNTPLTSRLLKPALVDVESGQLTDMRELPWYVTALLVSQPLHFGDYGGMPLKIIWAVLDVVTIIVLGSGLYLWLRRRRSPFEARLAELELREQEAFIQPAMRDS